MHAALWSYRMQVRNDSLFKCSSVTKGIPLQFIIVLDPQNLMSSNPIPPNHWITNMSFQFSQWYPVNLSPTLPYHRFISVSTNFPFGIIPQSLPLCLSPKTLNLTWHQPLSHTPSLPPIGPILSKHPTLHVLSSCHILLPHFNNISHYILISSKEPLKSCLKSLPFYTLSSSPTTPFTLHYSSCNFMMSVMSPFSLAYTSVKPGPQT